MKIDDEIFINVAEKTSLKIDDFLNKNNIEKKEVLFVSDSNIWLNNKEFFIEKFEEEFGDYLFINNPKADDFNCQKIIKKAQKFRFIFGFGSGTINDLCKFSAFKSHKKYFILASALSMNGYVSKNASIEINGHKKTLSATLPIAVFADLRILKKAPERMTKAGLADVLCFYSCQFDLILGHKVFLCDINKKSLKIQSQLIKKFEKNYHKYNLKDQRFLKILFKMILNSGWAMTIAGSSAPASQSEHLLAHIMTTKYYNRVDDFLHGELIANTAIISMENQLKILEIFADNLAKKALESFFDEINEDEIDSKLQKYFKFEVAIECMKEARMKRKYIQINFKKIIKNILKNHQVIYKSLQKNYYPSHNLIKIFEHFEVNFKNLNNIFSENEIQEMIYFSKFIRNRITSLDLL